MNDQESPIPEKCCAKCGFMYAISSGNINAESAIFDPDILRRNEFHITPHLTANSTISRNVISEKDITRRHQLKDLHFIGCLANIHPGNSFDPGGNLGEKSVSEAERMINLLRENRSSSCEKHFFPYHPGFSAKEHAEIRLQDQRDTHQQEFQERWNTILHNAEQYWQKKEDNFRQFNVVVILVNLVITIVLTLIINFFLNR